MSHEISVLESGLVEAMYANKPAWHGLGEIFDPSGTNAPDSATAARLSGLDRWTANKVPVASQWKGEGDWNVIKGQYKVERSDNGHLLGMVGETYKTFGNGEAFAFLDSLVMDGILRYESAMALRGGEIITMLARMPGIDTFAEGDHGLRYVMLTAGHDGKNGIKLLPTNVRVVCANTRRMAMTEGKKRIFSIKHTGKTEDRLAFAKDYISQFDSGFTLFRDQAQLLATRQVSGSQARDYIATMFPEKFDETGKLKSNSDKYGNEVRKYAMNPANTLRSIDGTWWGLYNAVTMAIDHSRLWKGGSAEGKFLSVMNGSYAAIKDRAFDVACSMAGVVTV
jgi:phage/plasmid-like protein (TIGR03299 family)